MDLEQGYINLMVGISNFFKHLFEFKKSTIFLICAVIIIYIIRKMYLNIKFKLFLKKIGTRADYKQRHPHLVSKLGEITCMYCNNSRTYRAAFFVRCSHCDKVLFHEADK